MVNLNTGFKYKTYTTNTSGMAGTTVTSTCYVPTASSVPSATLSNNPTSTDNCITPSNNEEIATSVNNNNDPNQSYYTNIQTLIAEFKSGPIKYDDFLMYLSKIGAVNIIKLNTDVQEGVNFTYNCITYEVYRAKTTETTKDTTNPYNTSGTIPTPAFHSDAIKLTPNEDGIITTNPTQNMTTDFDYPTFEEFFNDVILYEFAREINRSENSVFGKKEYSPCGPNSAPMNWVSLDSNNNVIITDEFIGYLTTYFEYIYENSLHVNEKNFYNSFDYSQTPGYNYLATLFDISEEEMKNLDSDLVKSKLNNLFKKIGDGEQDDNGNYYVSLSDYYTFISVTYGGVQNTWPSQDPGSYSNTIIKDQEDLAKAYARYCADKYLLEIPREKGRAVGLYVNDNAIHNILLQAYNDRGLSFAEKYRGTDIYQENFDEDYALVVLALKEETDITSQKVAQVLFRAAGINEGDSLEIQKEKLAAFAREISLTGGSLDFRVLTAHVIARGYNDSALYTDEDTLPTQNAPTQTTTQSKPIQGTSQATTNTAVESGNKEEPEVVVDADDWKAEMINQANLLGYEPTTTTGKYLFKDAYGTSYACIWDPLNKEFIKLVTTSTVNAEQEFSEDDKTLKPTLEGFYAESIIAAQNGGFEFTNDFGIYRKDGVLYEYDTNKREFVLYDSNLTYEERFTDNKAIKKTLANIYVEACLLAISLDYNVTSRFGIFEKDGVYYEYNFETGKFEEKS